MVSRRDSGDGNTLTPRLETPDSIYQDTRGRIGACQGDLING